jgi:transcriptional regulator with XRE-family HTH domain
MLEVNLGSGDARGFIRHALGCAQVSQACFARTMGVSPGALSMILSGKRQSSRKWLMSAAAAALSLGCPVRFLRPPN